MLLNHFLYMAKKIKADELPEIPKEFPQQQKSRQIPLYLQGAINAFVPDQRNRANICWSVIFLQLAQFWLR